MEIYSEVNQGTPWTIPDGQGGKTRLNRQGALVIQDEIAQAAKDGRIFCINAGTVTTPLTFGGGATIDVTKPQLWVSVPAGTSIIPLSLVVYAEAFGTSAQFECNAQVGTGGSRTSGGALIAPTNMRSDAPYTSTVTAYNGVSSPVFVGSTTNVSEFWRNGQQFAITKSAGSATASASDPNRFVWHWKLADWAPVLVDASQLAVHVAGQAVTGFITLVYVEKPSASVK